MSETPRPKRRRIIPLLLKVSIAPLVAGLILLIMLAWQIHATDKIEWNAATINQVGSQRMRLFKIALLTDQYTEYGEPKTRTLIDKEVTTFGAILHGLKYGAPQYGLKRMNDPESIAYLDKSVDEWNRTVKPLVQDVLATPASREELQTLDDRLEQYVVRIDGLVALRQAYSEKKVDALRNLVWLFLMVCMVIAPGSVIYIYVIILKPIKALAGVSRAIAAGDFSRTVPVSSKDELGELASGFNEMSVRLKSQIGALNQKTVELEAQKALIETDRYAILGLKRYAEDIIASLPAGLIVVDDTLRILSVNRSFRDLFGGEHGKELPGRKLEDVLPLPGLREQAQGALAGSTAVHGIDAVLGERQLRLTIAGIRLAEEEEEEERLLVVVEDVTEEQRLHELARAHETRYRDLVQDLDAIVWEAEAVTFVFTFVSRRAEALLGYSVERWLSRSDFWASLIHPEDRERVMASYRVAVAQGSAYVSEYRVVTADGRTVWLHDTVRVACDDKGRVQRLCGVMVDITERKWAEEWQQHYTQTLNLLTEDAPLGEVLEGLAAFSERQCVGALCSIQLLSPDGKHLMPGAAPSLPGFSNHTIEIGECSGSCGTTVALTGRSVIVADVLTHPCWATCRELTTRAGVRACWSKPILSGADKVLGTFSIYHREPRTPSPKELEFIRQGAKLAAVVIERARQQENLRLAAVVFEQNSEAVVITDAERRILSVNRAFTQATGYAPEEVIGQTPRILQSGRHDDAYYRAMWESIQKTDRWQGEIWDRHKTGEPYPQWLTISAVRDGQGEITHYVGNAVDVTEQKAQAAHIEQIAFYDLLTGLPNRALFMDRLKQTLASAERHGQRLAILFMDLNRFKEINDTQGHDVGDQALIEVARRFQAASRGEETLARLGGDEFIVIAEEADQAAAILIAERLQQALGEPIATKEHTFTLGVSIGIAFYPEDGANIEDLLKKADIAMYRAKASGGGYRFYQPEMSIGLAERMQLAKNLSRALSAGDLELYYQPQVNLQTGALIGAEALLRWNDSERGWVSPAEFIPIAEERGMMGVLGKWVLREACSQMKAWQEAGLEFPGRLAVNLAAQQLEESEIAEKLQAIVRASDLAPARLELELTESGLMENVEWAIGIMEALKTAGFALAIDDFGTGYSSLAYLKRFPADKLKIDMSFVRDMLKDRNDYTIVATIVGMAHNLGLKALAEGVEDAEQAKALLALGCDEAQGYFFGHPEPAKIFAGKWLTRTVFGCT